MKTWGVERHQRGGLKPPNPRQIEHWVIQSVADVMRHGRLRWFGHLECKSVDDWVSVEM